MTDQELRERFHHAVDATLSGLEGDPLLAQRVLRQAQPKEEPRMKKKISVGFAIVLALLLMSVTALAAASLWGVIDFTGRYGTKLLDSAADTVQTGISQQGGQGEVVSFTLREAICDGQAAYMVFDATPMDKSTLLIMDDIGPDEPALCLGKGYPENMTVAEYAESKGYTRIIRVGVSEDRDENGHADFDIFSREGVMTENGLTLSALGEGTFDETADMAFNLWVIDAVAEEVVEHVILTATLHVDEPLWTTSASVALDYPEAGVCIDGVEMTGTVMGIYSKVTFTVTDQAIYDSYDLGFWLEILDENGERMRSGALAQGSMSNPDENGQAHYIDSLQAMTEAPTTIGIRAYSCWTKERCEAITVTLGE